ncbi:cytochrome c biogenesis protein ResB [Tenuibacillus multivorans]|uniref:Cytochrome c biogenesis protein n=1 Tax=Tenuibacillus multivorans TaxID=237069 RepID=A0A1H0CXX0_9BACI|nr:cytochrome c biogenesis protein ResB [Tenuibacillus multivorans]GEL76121.1 cytochrome c biogenesis protein ResB [Tenuibacillus multivorans]SDN62752.1 cytochrome c biogenesis protein [Tenuibacillus multivorans]
MKNVKCECGHINHEGTVLCEACGKPIEGNQHIDGNDDNKVLNMRYEGSARRSRTYKRTIIDKTWNFFSSVKVGVWLIALALIAAAIGTIYPQEEFKNSVLPSSQFYEEQYGLTGKIFYQLGFHNLYSSWWFVTLIALIGISLVICSIDRVVPLYRALKNQKAKRHEIFVRRQRFFSETEQTSDEDRQTFMNNLRKRRYKITEDDGHILAEKNRFSRWGPYVNHIGLIIILIASILRMFDFMHTEGYVWVREGETKVVPTTDQEYYIKNEKFIYETYDRNDERFQEALKNEEFNVPSNFQTNVVIYKVKEKVTLGQEPELEEVARGEIRLNQPLTFDGYSAYQSGTQLRSEYNLISFNVENGEGQQIGMFEFRPNDDQRTYELGNDYKAEIQEYYPQFEITENGPSSFSKFPRNPGIIFEITGPNVEGERYFYLNEDVVPLSDDNEFQVSLEDTQLITASGLIIKKDYSLPFFLIGATIFMIGVAQGLYWHHRRVWLHPKDGKLLVAGHTNKNWFGLQKDIEASLKDTNIEMVKDQQEKF